MNNREIEWYGCTIRYQQAEAQKARVDPATEPLPRRAEKIQIRTKSGDDITTLIMDILMCDDLIFAQITQQDPFFQ